MRGAAEAVKFNLKTGDFRKALAGTEAQIAKAVTAGMRDATEGLKEDLRGDVAAAGLGPRLAKTWRGKTYPEGGESVEAAAFVWTKAPKIIDAFNRGVTIKSKDGFFLAIPTEYAGKGLGGGKITPGEWERRTGLRLRFVYRRGAPSLLVAQMRSRVGKGALNPATRFGKASARTKTGLATVVIFTLVPQTKLRKRLDVKAAGDRWAAKVPGLVSSHWS